MALRISPWSRQPGLVIVRTEQPQDAESVAALHDAAFAVPDEPGPTVESVLLRRLRTDGDLLAGLCFVAAEDGTLMGHVACSRGFVGDIGCVALGPIGVLPARQRAGVGSALMRAVLEAAAAAGEPAVFLLGEPADYSRFGFEPASAHSITAPDPGWGDYFQVRVLSSWDPTLTGVFRYPPAFDVG